MGAQRARGWVIVAVLVIAACGDAVPATPDTSSPADGTTTSVMQTTSPTAPPSSSGPPATVPTTGTVPATPVPTTPVPTTGDAASGPLEGAIVVLDPGHNGRNWAHPDEIKRQVDIGVGMKACNTTGAETADGYPEAMFTWEVATLAKTLLESRGATVLLTRSDNGGWGPCITERAAVGNDAAADAIVSIHADGAPPDARGFHVIHPGTVEGYTDDIAVESERLAEAMRDEVVAIGIPPATYVGVEGLDRRSDLGGLTLSDVPVVFLEAGNMRNPDDAALLTDGEGQMRIATAIAAAVEVFLTEG